MPSLLLQPHGNRLGDALNLRLQDPRWTTFRAAVAFVKRTGVNHISDNLRAFAPRGRIRMTVGVSMGGTSVEGLESLLECLDGRGEVWVFHNLATTFHPKMYVFSNDRSAEVIVGSGNLTQGGLFTNHEASIALTLDLADPDDLALLAGVESVLDAYSDRALGTAVELSRETLEHLRTAGYIVPEAEMHRAERRPATPTPGFGAPPAAGQLFRHVAVPPPPPIPLVDRDTVPQPIDETPGAFYMTASTDRRRHRSDHPRYSTAIPGDFRPPGGAQRRPRILALARGIH